jgi:hypothetical protein
LRDGTIGFWHDGPLSVGMVTMATTDIFSSQWMRYLLQAGVVGFAALPSVIALVLFLIAR